MKQISIDVDSEEPLVLSTSVRWVFFLLWYPSIIFVHIVKGWHNATVKSLNEHEDTAPPKYSVAGIGDLVVIVLYTPRILEKMFVYWYLNHKNRGRSFSEKLRNCWGDLKPVLSHWVFYAFVFVTFGASLTKGKSISNTMVIITQSTLLMSPFVVVLVNTRVLKRERVNWQIILTLLFTVVGSILLALGEVNGYEGKFRLFPDFSKFGKNFHKSDVLGIALGIVSAICFGLSSVILGYAVDNKHFTVSCENLFIAERLIRAVPFFRLTVAFGDLKQFKSFTPLNWCKFFGIAVLSKGLGSFMKVYATAKVGSTSVGIFLPIRLVSCLVTLMILEGERLNNMLQILGIVLVCLSLILYMIWKKYNDHEFDRNNKAILRHSDRPNMEPFSDIRLHHEAS